MGSKGGGVSWGLRVVVGVVVVVVVGVQGVKMSFNR